jgi:hypothetical protein
MAAAPTEATRTTAPPGATVVSPSAVPAEMAATTRWRRVRTSGTSSARNISGKMTSRPQPEVSGRSPPSSDPARVARL